MLRSSEMPTSEAPCSPTRWDRKKASTKRALGAAAIRLFSERGFDETTIEEIADAADVSARTFHRYFGTKEDVLFADAAERFDVFHHALAGRPVEEDILDSLRLSAHALAGSVLAEPADEVARQRLLTACPALRAHGLRHSNEWGLLVTMFVADRLKLDSNATEPQLVGGCVVAVLRTAYQQWARDPTSDLLTRIDEGFDLLANVEAALTVRSS